MKKKPTILLFSGPHGSGKDTIEKALRRKMMLNKRLIRYSTRPKSHNEVDGVDYLFINQHRFKTLESTGDFLESNHCPDGSSATSKKILLTFSSAPYIHITLNVEDALVLQKRLRMEDYTCELFFISPCTKASFLKSSHTYLKKIKHRLLERNRQTDILEERLKKAEKYREIFLSQKSEHFIYIENLDNKVDQAVNAIISYLETKSHS